MSLQHIAVIGAGTMGNGIAQVCAVAGFDVTLVDISDTALERGVATVRKNLERQVNKQTIDNDSAQAALQRILTTTDYAQLDGAQLVIEAATENLDLKLRLLNGSHSFLAYLGALAGKKTISDCMEDRVFKQAAHTLMIEEQAGTLTVPGGFDIAAYAEMLIARYSNRALQHQTTQIASDGSQKLPQRLLNPIRFHLEDGSDWTLSALAVAGWLKYCRGIAEDGAKLPVNDPFAERISDLASTHCGEAYAMKMLTLGDVFGSDLPANPAFVSTLVTAYQTLEAEGAAAALSASL